MSDYFDASSNRVTDGTTARASDVNNLRDEVGAGMDLLPSVAHIKSGLIDYGTTGGTADVITVTLPYPRTAYVDGLKISFKASAANTSTVTVNVDGLGAKSLVTHDGADLVAGDLVADSIYTARYNSTSGKFELLEMLDADLERQRGYAEEWATKAEDSLISTAAGGDGSTDYSALHHAAKGAASASAASTSASNASTSETNAAASASAASTSETNAAASETNAAASASSASTSASSASTSATNASASASAASTSASSASTSATNAAASASAASTSETNAAASETAAAASETAAAASETAAAASETAAAASETAAAASAATAAAYATAKATGNVMHPLISLPLKSSLQGDFVGPADFTRAGTATYINRYGFVREAAANTPRFEKDGLLIEGAGANIVNDAKHLDNDSTSWDRQQIDILKYYAESPDGNRGASKLVCNDTTSGYHNAQSPTITWALGTTYTWSVFAKADEWDYLCLSFPSSYFPANSSAYFNISAGTVVSAGAGLDSSGIESVGRGWYRCWVTATCTTGGSGRAQFWLTPDGSTLSFTGVPGKGVQVWGAQLEAIGFPTSFMPSTETFTSRASSATYWDSAGVLQTAAIDVERSSYNPGDLSAPPIQVLEDTSTNLCLYSEDLTNAAWEKLSTTIDSNVTAAPDGTTTADRINGVSTDRPRQIIGSLTAGVPYAVSVFAKADSSNWLRLRFNDTATWFDLSTGTIGTQYNEDAGIEDCGNGWYRCWIMDLPSSTVEAIEVSPVGANTSSTATGSVFLWGVQLEALPSPTSYIATTSAAVTRSADVWTSAVGTRAKDGLLIQFDDNHPSIQPGNGYTYVVDVRIKDGSPGALERTIIDGNIGDTEADRYSIFRFNQSQAARLGFYRGTGVTYDTGKADTKFRAGVVVSDSEVVDLFVDGVSVATSTAGVSLNGNEGGRSPTSIGIGGRTAGTYPLFGHLSNLRIYDFALTDAEMQIA